MTSHTLSHSLYISTTVMSFLHAIWLQNNDMELIRLFKKAWNGNTITTIVDYLIYSSILSDNYEN